MEKNACVSNKIPKAVYTSSNLSAATLSSPFSPHRNTSPCHHPYRINYYVHGGWGPRGEWGPVGMGMGSNIPPRREMGRGWGANLRAEMGSREASPAPALPCPIDIPTSMEEVDQLQKQKKAT
ncbi:hypothetical protein Ahy_A03g010820 isoform B [Arachis hypogaea]|uniref:Uncharacterized protein n=1 Tax=Arachis hypogaea TaxID=3818 RepID=A0A445DNM1_ARAHY|nr:hypothetical protein Ahy_A03g010820 isoform B [Arachis hypogaea]